LETTYIPRIRAVSSEDVRRVAGTYLRPSNCTLSLVLPAEQESLNYRELAYSFERRDMHRVEKPLSRPAERRSLTNGLKVIVEENHASETVGIALVFKGGLWAERSKPGIANLLCEVLTRGTLTRSREELTQEIDRLGITLEASPDRDLIILKVACASRVFPEAFRLLSEIAFEPSFERNEVEKARSLILDRIESLKDDPYEFAGHELRQLIYGPSVYSKHELGTAKSVASVKIADLKEFHWRSCSPANAVMSIVGDIDQEVAFQLARNVLGSLPSGGEFEYDRLEVPDLRESSELRIKRDQSQVILEMGFMGPSVLDEDYVRLKPAVAVLGNRLFYKYVYDEPIAYRMWVWISPLAGPSAIRFETGVAREDFDTAHAGVKGAVEDLIDNGFSEEELELAKSDIIQSFILAHETNLKRSHARAKYEVLGLGFDYLERYPGLIGDVSLDSALEAARIYMSKDSQVVVITGRLEE
jgi:zinc protease